MATDPTTFLGGALFLCDEGVIEAKPCRCGRVRKPKSAICKDCCVKQNGEHVAYSADRCLYCFTLRPEGVEAEKALLATRTGLRYRWS